ncbi:hypothetical protein Patl1_08784 [Pistacia atlantica]|uniref:Uncharacterized protein n=1 Tax=Pistacia atlantica TaxID=434234 RepID=A0ACC1AIL6_9ROSI|nr:hypothetical protein Patl1_08784 [Pistacia atlantica]
MNRMNKVHSQGRSVPFSWENEPGVSKVITNEEQQWRSLSLRLPPPPCPKDSARFTVHDIQIPLPPCAFQPPSRSSSKKGLDQDPFFVAFKECTKTSTTTTKSKLLPKLISSNRKRGIFNFFCTRSCSVIDDNLMKISQLPCKKDEDW